MSMPGYVAAKHVITLEPITPVHVWSGKEATIGVDAFIYQGRLYLIDERVFNLLEPRELETLTGLPPEKMTSTIIKLVTSKRNFDRVLGPGIEVPSGPLPQNARVRLMHKNLVPGSTLKGYLRTAVIRKMLSGMDPRTLSSLFTATIKLRSRPVDVGTDLETVLLRERRLSEQGGFIDVMEAILVSDPTFNPGDVKLAVRSLRVVHKTDLSNVARVAAVVLEKGVLEFDVTIVRPPESGEKVSGRDVEDELKRIFEARRSKSVGLMSKQWLLEALRLHGCELIEKELEKVGVQKDLKGYIDLLNSLKRDLCIEGSQCAPARIGFMAGHEAKTILDLVNKFTPDIYTNIVKYMAGIVRRTWDAMTLKIVETSMGPLGVGWCKLCLK